jgi:3-oxoacyl-[acyl-carrier protein] reductase
MKRDNKIFLITGTSRGIGQSMALYFLEKGHTVIGCSRTDANISNILYDHYKLDLSEEKDILDFFKKIRGKYRYVDVLVNNAAINPVISNLSFISFQSIESVFKVNVFAPMLLIRESIKLMSRRKFGRIINIGSMAVKHEVKGESLYTATKASLNSITRIIAKEVNKLGITVNLIAPSAIRTELSGQIDPEALRKVLELNAIPTFGDFNQVNSLIDFLVQEKSNGITGQLIYLGGA